MMIKTIPIIKLGAAGLFALSLGACVGINDDDKSSSSTAPSSVPVSSESSPIAVSSILPSSSSMPSSSSEVSSSSVVMISSSSVVSSSSETSNSSSEVSSSSKVSSSSEVMSSSSEATDCSSVDTTAGENFYTSPVKCVDCHGTFDGMVFPGGTALPRAIDPNSLTKTTNAELADYLRDNMAAGFNQSCNGDADCNNRALELAKYINQLSNDTTWCDGLEASSSSISSSSIPAADPVVLYAVNAGGQGHTAQDGTVFVGDGYFEDGNLGSTDNTFQNTQDQPLFKTERWGEFTYNFPLKDGSYDIALYMGESWFTVHPDAPQGGSRLFDVFAEDNVVIDDYNPLDFVSGVEAHIIERNGVQVVDGNLTLKFVPSVDQAGIRAIVVKGLEGNKLPYEPDLGTAGTAPVPADCSGNSTVEDQDFVLFDGSQVSDASGAGFSQRIELHGGWVASEVWANGASLALEDAAGSKAIAYSNAGIFTGFKLSPPSLFGEVRAFKFSGVDIYLDYVTNDAENNLPTFGLRVNYEGEQNPDGPGGASTAQWAVDENNQRPFSTQSKSCSLLKLKAPLNWNWDAPGNMSNKLIWEVKEGWDNGDKMRIRRIVFKDFEYAQ